MDLNIPGYFKHKRVKITSVYKRAKVKNIKSDQLSLWLTSFYLFGFFWNCNEEASTIKIKVLQLIKPNYNILHIFGRLHLHMQSLLVSLWKFQNIMSSSFTFSVNQEAKYL